MGQLYFLGPGFFFSRTVQVSIFGNRKMFKIGIRNKLWRHSLLGYPHNCLKPYVLQRFDVDEMGWEVEVKW